MHYRAHVSLFLSLEISYNLAESKRKALLKLHDHMKYVEARVVPEKYTVPEYVILLLFLLIDAADQTGIEFKNITKQSVCERKILLSEF